MSSSGKHLPEMSEYNLALITAVEAHSHRLQSIVFSPNGELLAIGDKESSVKVWSVSTGNQVCSLDFAQARIPQALVFTQDSKRIVSATEWYAAIEVWDAQSGQRINVFENEDTATFHDRIGQNEIGYYCLDFSNNDSQLAVGGTQADNGMIQIWEFGSQKLQLAWKAHDKAVSSIAFSPDGQFIASGGMDYNAKLWNPSSGELINVLPHETALPKFLSDVKTLFSPKGDYLVTESFDRFRKPQLCFWDTFRWRKISTLHGYYSPVFSQSSNTLATANIDRDIVLWDTETLEQKYKFSQFTQNEIFRILLSSDGLFLVTAENSNGSGSSISLWKLPQI